MNELQFVNMAAKHQNKNQRLLKCIKSCKPTAERLIDVRQCLEQRADVNTTDDEGRTPLHLAVLLNERTIIVKLLLKRGANVNSRRAHGFTPLHDAVRGRETSLVQLLLDSGADIYAEAAEGTPLHVAARHGNTSAIELLLKKGTYVNVEMITNRYTPLHEAVDSGQLSTIEILLDNGAKINAISEDGFTPLMKAVSSGNMPVLELLLNKGAYVNTTNDEGATALHLAVLHYEHAIIVKLLMKRGANVNTRRLYGYTPLHDAVRLMKTSLVQILLDNGADIYAEAQKGKPLHVAARYGNISAIELLLKKDADVNTKMTTYGYTPLHEAVDSGHKFVVEMLLDKGAALNALSNNGLTPLMKAARSEHMNVAEVLMYKGAEVNAQSHYSDKLLIMAVKSEHKSVLQFLLNKGVNVNAKTTSDKYTPLHEAARSGHTSIVELLLKAGAEVNAQANDGCTPLMLAAQYGHMSVMQLLLNRGANIKLLSKDGQTALHKAAGSGHIFIVELLLNKSAEINAQLIYGCTPLIPTAQNGFDELVGHKNIVNLTTYTYMPLHSAVFFGKEPIVELLLKKGANVNGRLPVQTESGYTPLHLAVKFGFTSIVMLLLRNGADINVQDRRGITPLHVAVFNKNTALVTLLVNRGADVMVRNREGDTPLNCALIFCPDHDIASVLRTAKKNLNSSILQNPKIQDTSHSNPHKNKLQLTSTDTSGLPGQLYETKMLTLLLIRMLNDEQIEHDILLGTNIDGIGAMDDICLRYQVKGQQRPVVLFIQVKHREDSEKGKLTDEALWSDDGDFSLLKYFKSYLMIKERFRLGNEDPMFRGKFDDVDCYFVLYTTTKDILSKNNMEKGPSEIMHILLSTEQNTKPFQYKWDKSDINRLTEMAIEARIEKSKADSEQNLNSEANYFFSRLWFYSGQVKQDKLERIVKCDISKYYNNENDSIHFKCDTHSNAIFLRSHHNIQRWWMQKGEAPYLTRSDDFFKQAKQAYLDDVWRSVVNAMNCLKIPLDVAFSQYTQSKHSFGTPRAFNNILHRLFKIIDIENIIITVNSDLKNNVLNQLLCENQSQNAFNLFSSVSKDAISCVDQQNYQLYNYSKRSGTSEICGLLFRTKMLGLVSLRMLHQEQIEQDPSPVYGTKICGIGVMNDICLRVRVKGEERPVMLFMRLKHIDDPEKGRLTNESLWSESGEFSFQKHFVSYIMIKERFQFDDKERLFKGDFGDFDCFFGLFTSAKENISKKRTENKMNKIVQDLLNTRQDSEPFQYEYDEADVIRLTSLTVTDEIRKLGKVFLECLNKPKKLNPNLLTNTLIARYHVVMRREVLRPCDEQPEINKYRLWRFSSEFLNSDQEHLVTLKEILCKNITSEKGRKQLESAQIKLPLRFGNLDMTFSENEAKAQKRIKTLADEIVQLLKLNKDTKFVEISDDDVGPGKTIQQNVFNFNGGIGSAVGNLLVYDTVTNMLKFDLINEALPHYAALVLKELENDRHKPFNEDLSIYRIKVNIKGFPKISFEDYEYDKIQARGFFENFWFFCDQAQENEVECILSDKINEKYSSNRIGNSHNNARHISDFIATYSHDLIQKLWIQIKEPYLDRASDIFEIAQLEDIYNLLQTVINYMYLFDIYSINIRMKRIYEKDSEKVQALLERIVIQMFRLFYPEFNQSIYFSYCTGCGYFDTSKLSLTIQPEMEWVALVLTEITIADEYRVVAKIDPRNLARDGLKLNESITQFKETRYRDCFEKEDKDSWKCQYF